MTHEHIARFLYVTSGIVLTLLCIRTAVKFIYLAL